ncbi:hypothetical protein [Paraburkholderia sp. MM5477-R1]|uniref:hypothetical protein n=1 Tax=Paraburkholderia sp. MM5477-R1 TaxID=2991062 RepID=UPI003D1EC596
MSSRHNKPHRFDADLPELTTSERDQPTPGPDDRAMRELQRGSEAIVRLATQAHAAVARERRSRRASRAPIARNAADVYDRPDR